MRRARSIGRPQPGTGGLRSARIPAESAPRPAPPGSSRHEPSALRRYRPDRRGLLSFLSAPRPRRAGSVRSLPRRTRRFRAAASWRPAPRTRRGLLSRGTTRRRRGRSPAAGRCDAVRSGGRAAHCAAGARPSWRRAGPGRAAGGERRSPSCRALELRGGRCGGAGGAERGPERLRPAVRCGVAAGKAESGEFGACSSREGSDRCSIPRTHPFFFIYNPLIYFFVFFFIFYPSLLWMLWFRTGRDCCLLPSSLRFHFPPLALGEQPLPSSSSRARVLPGLQLYCSAYTERSCVAPIYMNNSEPLQTKGRKKKMWIHWNKRRPS